MERIVALVVEGREIPVALNALITASPFLANAFLTDPTCERYVFCCTSYAVVDALLQSCIVGDNTLLENIWRDDGPHGLSGLLSLLEMCVCFEVDALVFERTIEALTRHVHPGNVVHVLRTCLAYIFDDHTNGKAHLRLLKEVCCRSLPPILRSTEDAAAWGALKSQYNGRLVALGISPFTSSIDVSGGSFSRQSPHLLEPIIEELLEAKIDDSNLQQLSLESSRTKEEMKELYMPCDTSTSDVIEKQRRDAEGTKRDVLAARKNLDVAQHRYHSTFVGINDSEELARQCHLLLQVMDETVLHDDEELLCKLAGLHPSEVVHRSLIQLYERKEEERFRLDTLIALGESRLRAVQRKIRAVDISVERLNDSLKSLTVY
ncbi:hypothetical protein TraAM80_03435 [Trypanosoma rangeli]|uniref:Uncharacterized protein n=1 Tax=Trypanosoma rangeli TaxID=5698 RepID=A0A422NPY9_TRYRA|nr:uncharacterized protein TraAM80_03435 [Trypanosoma rangeli]RNF07459.1 hypothetical protein TraAM80_03435 [Trypanosoma rangeli]|eukprot:RNF07459.1 hypothetical protein TraAM80_03435 [Trypanosoma rangeli]